METARTENRHESEHRIDIESRFRSVKLSSLKSPIETAFNIRVAGVVVRIAFDSAWEKEIPSMCRSYWSPFLTDQPGHRVEIILSPADAEFIDQRNPLWNEPLPFQERIDDPTGTWIFHRDFTGLVRGSTHHAWLPKPTPTFTDALDNILSVAIRPEAEKQSAFLFHSAIIEHDGKAVVLFGPSGIGKSTVAKLSREAGFRVMSSDQAYLRIEHMKNGDRLLASASPTRNPEIPRTAADWVTGSLEVKALFALKRTGAFEIKPMDRSEMTRRFFSEIFRDETDSDFIPALKFACDVAMLRGVKQASLSYPYGFNFWPQAAEIGYL